MLVDPLVLLAFIPQIVDPGQGAVLGQFLIFGAVLSLGGLVINGAVGVMAGGIGRHLEQSAQFARVLGYVSVGIFGALALRLAVMERA